MREENIKESVFHYLRFLVNVGSTAEFSNDKELLESGMIDSLGLFKLVSYLEDKHNIQIQPSEITIENFSTPADIIEFVKTRINTKNTDISLEKDL